MPLLESSKKRFYKLPYIGNFSVQTKKKLNKFVVINLFVVAVKLITLVARSDIYQLGLKNIGKQTKSIQTSK